MLCQLELCAQTQEHLTDKEQSKAVHGALTDLFALGVAIRTPPTAAVKHPIFYMSKRITSPKSYVLQLLLLMCNLQQEDYDVFVSESNSDIPVFDSLENESDVLEPTTAKPTGGVGKSAGSGGVMITTSNKPPPSTKHSRLQAKMEITCADEYDEDREEAIRELLSWDYRRRGLTYLSEEELLGRNNSQTSREEDGNTTNAINIDNCTATPKLSYQMKLFIKEKENKCT